MIPRASVKKGSILVITLWILVILSVLALGLGRRAAINLGIAAYQRDRLKADYIARAGVKKAIWLLDNSVDQGNSRPEDIYSQAWGSEQGDGFKIGNFSAGGDFILGFQDEENRINVNGMGASGAKALLTRLLEEKNIANSEQIAQSLSEWIDSDIQPDKPLYKNGPLARPEELLEALQYFYAGQTGNAADARKYARQTYAAIKDLITVYGDKINVNTVPVEVLRAVAKASADTSGRTENDAEYLSARIIEHRTQGPFKDNDDLGSFSTGDDNADALFTLLKQAGIFGVGARYFRFTVIAQSRGITNEITAIYDRADDPANRKLVYWHEN